MLVDSEGRGPTQRQLAEERNKWDGVDVALLPDEPRHPDVCNTSSYLLHQHAMQTDCPKVCNKKQTKTKNIMCIYMFLLLIPLFLGI